MTSPRPLLPFPISHLLASYWNLNDPLFTTLYLYPGEKNMVIFWSSESLCFPWAISSKSSSDLCFFYLQLYPLCWLLNVYCVFCLNLCFSFKLLCYHVLFSDTRFHILQCLSVSLMILYKLCNLKVTCAFCCTNILYCYIEWMKFLCTSLFSITLSIHLQLQL